MNTKSIKVVFCANSSWYLYNFRKTTIKAFVLAGFDVHCIAPRDNYSEKIEGIGASFSSFKFHPNSLNPFIELMTLWDLIKIYFKIRQHYTFNFTPKINIYSSLAAQLVNSSVVNNISGLGSAFLKKSVFSFFIMMLYRISNLKVKKIFFQNKRDMNLFLEKNIVHDSKCELINGSGVDLDEFYFSEMTNAKTVRFILMCRLIKEKGVYLFAEAAKELKKEFPKKLEFVMAGFIDKQKKDAVTIDQINEWQKEDILNYLGPLEDVKNELSKSHCAVLPTFYPEGLPKFLIESAAMGKIIVASNSPGCSEVIDDDINGYLCEPQSLSSLMDCLRKVIKLSSEERNEMSFKSRLKAEKMFSDKIIIEKYLNCIQNC
jgi:glycosyltransferase involved in cell wall biosynthesis